MNKTKAAKCGSAALFRRLWLGVALAQVGLLAAGCHTTEKSAAAQAAGEGIAAVQIRGNTPGQITEAAAQVFEEHGYTRGSRRSSTLIFEKKGSKLSNLAYGNWTGGIPIWTRVKLAIISTGEAEYTLQCNAFHVRDKGGATEEELRIGKLNSGPYKKLLEEIAARFKGPNSAKPAFSALKN